MTSISSPPLPSGGSATKKRLDILIYERGLTRSRQHAAALIMAGKVFVNGAKVEKAGAQVGADASVRIVEDRPYVSRGGVKLAGALEHFAIDPRGLVILDAGASTGGFTHCLLEKGARRVVCVDVGYGQMDWQLRNDPRVLLTEHTNIRRLEPEMLPVALDAAVADLSFISLKLVFPVIRRLLRPGSWFLPLVKPQFEVGKANVGKGGVVRNLEHIARALAEVKAAAAKAGFEVRGEVESSIRGAKGNREFFLYLVSC
uniref:TlyA family RNA methyltransferase n=1 Tax=Desulfomonile tiedjei TaxID=2358 RepID=A0A7C4AQM6_9BACT